MFKHFWKAIEAYKAGAGYGEVLKLLVIYVKKEIVSHRKISNNNINTWNV